MTTIDRSSGTGHTAEGPPPGRLLLLGVLAAPLLGLLVATSVDLLTALIVGTGLIAAGLIVHLVTIKPYQVFWVFLIFLLLGYQFLGKGFAYVGVAPLFVSEVGLAIGLLSALFMLIRSGFKVSRFLVCPPLVALYLFMAWGAARTLPFLDDYGANALRDGVLWGYGAYTILICLLIPRDVVDRYFVLYGQILVYFLWWLPIAFFILRIIHPDIRFPGAPVTLINVKSGDVGVHLAGIAAFILLRLDKRTRPWPQAQLWALWALWGVAWLAFGATNRGGMLSALIGVAVVFVWRWKSRWDRPLILGVAGLALLFATNFNISLDMQEVSPQRMIQNFQSLFMETSAKQLEGTKEWRLNWWRTITNYTVGGQYFWGGKGYGINLAMADGFGDPNREVLNRHPHNATFNILARTGVPGLVLWLTFLSSFAWMLWKRFLAARRHPFALESRYVVWLTAYWVSFLFNSSVDVFLEGPMGGIWFWSLSGMCLVYCLKQPQPAPGPVERYNHEPHGSAVAPGLQPSG